MSDHLIKIITCVCTQILVKYSKCKFIAFKKEVNSFKSGILITANIISCSDWIRQSKSNKHNCYGLLFHLTLLSIHIRASQIWLYLRIIRSLFKKYWFQGKRIKRQDMMREKKGSTEDRSWGLTQRFQKDKKEWEKKILGKEKEKKKSQKLNFRSLKKSSVYILSWII